jgi:formylglycine-generating enzyme required for sulfatase activity
MQSATTSAVQVIPTKEDPKVLPAWSIHTDTLGPIVQIALDKETLRFRHLPAGFFRLGASAPPDRRDKPIITPVTFSKPIWLAQSEVTQELWENVMGTNPSAHKQRETPVESVSFSDIQRFIKLLESRLPGLKVRLPTEAEWEYGAVCGKDSYDSDQAEEREWHRLSVRRQGTGDFPQPRERRQSNLWGLYDMLGNVREWTTDTWTVLDGEPRTDPIVLKGGTNRVVKGGCYAERAEECTPWKRSQADSEGASEKIGFRLVLLAPMTGKTLPEVAK